MDFAENNQDAMVPDNELNHTSEDRTERKAGFSREDAQSGYQRRENYQRNYDRNDDHYDRPRSRYDNSEENQGDGEQKPREEGSEERRPRKRIIRSSERSSSSGYGSRDNDRGGYRPRSYDNNNRQSGEGQDGERSGYQRRSYDNNDNRGYGQRYSNDRPQNNRYDNNGDSRYRNDDNRGYRPRYDNDAPSYRKRWDDPSRQSQMNFEEKVDFSQRQERAVDDNEPRSQRDDNGRLILKRRPRPEGSEQEYERRPSFRQDNDNYQRNDDRQNRPYQRDNNYRQDNRYDNRPNNRYDNHGDNRYGNNRFENRYDNRNPYQQRFEDQYEKKSLYSHKKQVEFNATKTIEDGPMRLNRYIAQTGVCSRRQADEYIKQGMIKVNGEVVSQLGVKINVKDEIKFDDSIIKQQRKVYILLNKPKGYVTTADDPNAEHTVMDLIQGACKERVYPVGRLDKSTTGVLLLTNDGELTKTLTHPTYNKKKVYQVYLDKSLREDDMEKLSKGVELEDGETFFDAISYIDPDDKKMIGVEIHSGKNRIIRRMFEHAGYTVLKLDRVYFAGLTKKGLRRGDWRFLRGHEMGMLKMGSYD
jgi:23S rRNA pseudouridine2605 synthase